MSEASAKPIVGNLSQHRKAISHDRGGVIKFHLLLRLAFKNLFFKKLRTSLTVLGVVIGIGAIVFLVSFGFGLQNLVGKQIIGSKSVKTIDVTSAHSKVIEINQANLSAMSQVAGVDSVSKEYIAAGKAKLNNSQIDTVVYGTDKNYLDLSSLNVVAGKAIDDSRAGDILVNTSLLKAIGLNDNQKAIGQTTNLTFEATNSQTGEKHTVTKDLKIHGVIDSGSGAEIFASDQLFEAEGVTNANQAKVVAVNKNDVSNIRKAVESLGFTTASPLDTLDQINQVFTLLQFVLLGFGGIGMIIAILGMFNTLTISLLERTREIGLMISLGARQSDVRRLFVTEALILSLMGAFIGIVGAFLFGRIGDVILNTFAHHRGVTDHVSAFSFSLTLMVAVIIMSGLIGLAVVYFPAKRASRINPIDALRYE